MKRLVTILALLTLPVLLRAQQDGHFTQFMFNKQYFNPAYSGMRNVPTISAAYRKQWIGFDGAPQIQQLAFNTPVPSQRIGIGVLLNRQTIGITQTVYAALSYSYSLVERKLFKLKLGLQGCFGQFAINYADKDLVIAEPNDPSVRDAESSRTAANVGAGLYLGNPHTYIGLSVPHIIESYIGFNDIGTLSAIRTRHYYAMGGAEIPLGADISLLPAFLLKKAKGVPIGYDLNLGIQLFDKFTLGTSLRGGGSGGADSMDFLMHLVVMRRLGIGISYDYTLSPLKDFSKGSVEVLLQFDLRERDATNGGGTDDLSNPRFFF